MSEFAQRPQMQFSPFNGKPLAGFKDIFERAAWKSAVTKRTWTFNPWTGARRAAADVSMDPHGGLIWEADWPTPVGHVGGIASPPDPNARVGEIPSEQTVKAPAAPEILDAAAGHMRDRAATYDQPGGERSMGKTVAAFNVITGRDLSESEGWLLMQILKDVRDRQRSEPHRDSLEDCVAYSALKAEARLQGK
jgi:hypothetical protein